MAKFYPRFQIHSLFYKKVLLFSLHFVVFCIIIGGVAVSFFSKLPFYCKIAVTLVLLAALYGQIHLFRRQNGILGAGKRGEKESKQLLSLLPDSCIVLSDLTVRYKQHRSQIDHIVISPYGVSVVEVKYIKGVLRGQKDDRILEQIKFYGKGQKEEKTVYNPILQVQNHGKTVANLLAGNEIACPVHTYVYLANPGGICEIKGSDNVFPEKEKQKLLQAVCAGTKAVLTKVEQKKACRVLYKSK